jgi:hypothetical protein
MAAHMKFWLNRERDDHPMFHLPWQLAHDNASLFGEDYQSLRKALEFDDRKSTPYEKTGIGSVENRWKVIWQWELEWSEDYETILLSEYNMLLHEAMANEQHEEHPYINGQTKGAVYQQSMLSQEPRPRVVEVDVMSLMHSTYERTVTHELSISVDGEKLRVPQYWYGIDLIGEKVKVFKNYRGEWRAELMKVPDYAVDEARTPFDLTEFVHRSMGDFSGSHQLTYQQRLKEQIKNGDGLYEAIMAGEVALDDEGLPFDIESGEYIEAAKPVKLQPKREVLEPASPFVEGDKGTELQSDKVGRKFDSTYQARVWIGQQLRELGIDYAQVDSYFGPRLMQEFELRRDLISEAVDRLKQNLNRDVVNG